MLPACVPKALSKTWQSCTHHSLHNETWQLVPAIPFSPLVAVQDFQNAKKIRPRYAHLYFVLCVLLDRGLNGVFYS